MKRPESILAFLRGNLAAVQGLTGRLADEDWVRRPEPGEWAPVEILSHLRDVDREVNQPRIDQILSRDEPFLSAMDPDRWAEQRGYLRGSGPQARLQFLSARQETLRRLESLDEAAWSRPARHALLGPTDLAEILCVAIEHDRLHLAQLRDTIPSEALRAAIS